MSRIVTVILIYRRHKPIDLTLTSDASLHSLCAGQEAAVPGQQLDALVHSLIIHTMQPVNGGRA
jgi:hypothetical protein